MFLGIICACIPSAAHSVRHKDSVQRRLCRTISSQVKSMRSNWVRTNGDSQTSYPGKQHVSQNLPTPNVLDSTDRKYGAALTMNNTDTEGYSNSEGDTDENFIVSASTVALPKVMQFNHCEFDINVERGFITWTACRAGISKAYERGSLAEGTTYY